jgi:hypothetical protein
MANSSPKDALRRGSNSTGAKEEPTIERRIGDQPFAVTGRLA